MARIKICGMRDAANIKAVEELRPDYLGFIFYDRSPRYVGSQSFQVVAPGVRPVGVFVNESTENILRRLESIGSSMAQLHGNESPAECEALQRKNISVIKVFSVDDSFDFKKTKEYQDVTDYFLFDTKGKFYGGNATPFNWEKLQEYDQSKPFFLSGGLNEKNTRDLDSVKQMNLYALDFNSGVEDSPGLKNIEKIKNIISCLK